MSAPPTRKWAIILVLFAAVAGIIDGILLTWDHLQFVLQTDDGVCSDVTAATKLKVNDTNWTRTKYRNDSRLSK